jgi:hypothetical protein
MGTPNSKGWKQCHTLCNQISCRFDLHRWVVLPQSQNKCQDGLDHRCLFMNLWEPHTKSWSNIHPTSQFHSPQALWRQHYNGTVYNISNQEVFKLGWAHPQIIDWGINWPTTCWWVYEKCSRST